MDYAGMPQSKWRGTNTSTRRKSMRRPTGCFALSRDDCWIENYDLGFFRGPESVKRFLWIFHENMDGMDVRGSFCEHTLTTEVMAVADDPKTAKACWMSPGCENAPGREQGN